MPGAQREQNRLDFSLNRPVSLIAAQRPPPAGGRSPLTPREPACCPGAPQRPGPQRAPRGCQSLTCFAGVPLSSWRNTWLGPSGLACHINAPAEEQASRTEQGSKNRLETAYKYYKIWNFADGGIRSAEWTFSNSEHNNIRKAYSFLSPDRPSGQLKYSRVLTWGNGFQSPIDLLIRYVEMIIGTLLTEK
eukprot:bmy_03041T0